MIKTNQTYSLNQLLKELDIPKNQWIRRKEDLLEWLKQFFDYTTDFEAKTYSFTILDIYEEEYRPLPRKNYDNYTIEEKEKDYKQFVIEHLPKEFEFNSKAKMAREAIKDFGSEKYGHCSDNYVAHRFISKPMETYGEPNNEYRWVWSDSYEELSPEQYIEWLNLLRKHKVEDKEILNAFYSGDKPKMNKLNLSFEGAIHVMYEKYRRVPIRAQKWRERK